jgi:5'-3' exonuclease
LGVQIPVILDVLAAYGLAVVGAPDMEADDVIGTLATGAGMPVDVVTGDRDLFQLVDDDAQIRVLYTARGVSRHERVDNAWVRAKYGVDAAQYADFATLRGDASDGLPGVAGVGEKTAATLLERYTDLASILAAAADPGSSMAPGPRRKIAAGRRGGPDVSGCAEAARGTGRPESSVGPRFVCRTVEHRVVGRD